MLSPPALPWTSPPATEPKINMGFDFVPHMFVSPPIFGFLKSLDLRTMGKGLGDGERNPIVVESSTRRIGPEDSCVVDVENILDEPLFNFDPVEKIVNSDSDESDSAVRVKQT